MAAGELRGADGDRPVALITGASRGLGEAIAHALAADFDLALVARDETLLNEVAQDLQCISPSPGTPGEGWGEGHPQSLPKSPHPNPLPEYRERGTEGKRSRVAVHAADLGDAAAIDPAFDAVVADLGRVDVLVNNAAIQGPIGGFDEVDFGAWQAVFAVNLFAPARLCQRMIRHLKQRGRGGKIINLSGGGATSPRPHVSAYGVSKCALVRLTETLAVELRGSGIDINAVAPGAMNTRMLDQVLEAGKDAAPLEYDAAAKRQREGGDSVENAAALVAFLASPASDGISGRLISAVWDDWRRLTPDLLTDPNLYTLRRVTPKR